MEESISHLEKTAQKLYPILEEVERRMIDEKTTETKMGNKGIETLDTGDIESSRKPMVIRK
jgi:hypothetical protein